MNNKITFPKLASLLADKSGRSKRFSEDFLREFFALISDQLEAGESVKVKGLGTFRLSRVEPRKSVDVTTGMPMEISGHSKVVFTPAKELAEAVNAPFEAFATVEIGDDVDINELVDNQDVLVQEDSRNIDLGDPGLAAELPVVVDDTDSETSVEISDVRAIVETPLQMSQLQTNEGDGEKYDDFEVIDEPDGYSETPYNDAWQNTDRGYERRFRVKRQWLWAVVFGLGCAALGVLITFAVWSLLTKPNLNKPEKTVKVVASNSDRKPKIYENNIADSIDDEFEISEEELANLKPLEVDPVPTAPSDALEYDTIGTSRFLTTMAKAHYGNNKLWPYIYEENKDNIGHPDKIRPGTPIRIPNLSKFGVDPKNPADIEKANKLAVEIYARYGKKI